MSSAAIEKLIRSSDKRLSDLDERTIEVLENSIMATYQRLEAEIARKWGSALDDVTSKSSSFAEARARVLLKQLGEYLSVIQGTAGTQISSTHVNVAIKSEDSAVFDVISHYEPNLMTFTRIPTEVITELSSTMAGYLTKHSDEFVDKAREIMTSGLVQGKGFQAMARELRAAVGGTIAAAERVVRTESMRASDVVRRDRYKQTNIGYVQRIATMDARVCSFCGSRAGSVYEVGSGVQSLHPNDRCYNVPWKREWYDLGLIDNDWVLRHYQESLEKSGGKIVSGAAPFERANGSAAPKPIWTPAQGFV